jgi:hypothetical protein
MQREKEIHQDPEEKRLIDTAISILQKEFPEVKSPHIIGRGGYGVVIHDPETARAFKVVFNFDGNPLSADAEHLTTGKRVATEREVKNNEALTGFSPQLYEFIERPSYSIIVMEYIKKEKDLLSFLPKYIQRLIRKKQVHELSQQLVDGKLFPDTDNELSWDPKKNQFRILDLNNIHRFEELNFVPTVEHIEKILSHSLSLHDKLKK